MVTRTLLIFALLAFFVSSCTSTRPLVITDQYHDSRASQEKAPKSLNGLQLEALKRMNKLEFQQSIEYLQRAVKVDPRDPLNWHYLAQNYWHLNDFPSCRSMIQRAQSYSQFDQDLIRANETLLKQCAP